MGSIKMTTTLVPRGPAAAVVLDDAQVAELGNGAKRFPVSVTVNGGFSWRTTVARMRGEFLIGFSREVRDGAGVSAGDEIEILIEPDTEPREVDVPEVLASALAADPAARAGFDGLSYTHRKEYARWISEAKREETRDRRLADAIARLREGRPPRGPR